MKNLGRDVMEKPRIDISENGCVTVKRCIGRLHWEDWDGVLSGLHLSEVS